MRRVSVGSLKPEMKIARTIYGNIGEALLKNGVKLTTTYIKRLAKHSIPFVYVDDGLIPDVVVEDVVTLETRLAAVRQVKNILLETKESGRLVIEPQAIYGTVNQFAGELLSKESLMLNLVDLRSQDDYTFAHSVNVCVLALMTGITLGYDKKHLATLGVGALLHDLGKVKVPDSILNKPGKLTPEEFAVMKEHPIFGYELIKNARGLDEITAIIALQHHESFDGTGYPHGISRDNFHEYAQITAIADKFDALTANRVYRKGFPPHEAYEMCAASGDYLFKGSIAKAFLHSIAAYPSGTLVELSNGQLAVVLDTPKGYSLFPRVRVLYDQRHLPLPPREVSLLEEKQLAVVKVLPEDEIQQLLQQ